ncbi:hypothetical protein P389DRAFT_169843 [Cystobasidium minutum MCA 4210]|uniref:uncharacterized protein n=1 Tax=Cystobasidium minutum MCA 4210 TaxID=1397322 RepID=UPI0034CF6401|eukprot:jgi/Rhomi1/169843/fgenesh1_kg.3_\
MALNMPPSEFTPVSVSDNARLWKGDIGLMNTSKTNVVFTIDSLIAFLKTHQIEVDSNLNEFKNLPKYASFGTMSPVQAYQSSSSAPAANTAASASPVQAVVAPSHNVVNPSSADAEDVRDSAGRGDHGTLQQQHVQANATAAPVKTVDPDAFIPTRKVRQPPGGGTLTIGNLFGGDEAPAQNRRVVSNGSSVLPEDTPFAGQGFIPTRKVREPPGGKSQISAIFG